MRFLFWTFLDNLKMSIFGFLKEMFFWRTEKSGNIIFYICRTENGKENAICKIVFFQKFRKRSPLNWTFLNVVVVDTDNHNDNHTL